jgi:hypothetical protein
MAALPSVGNAVQSSEMMRNSLGLNYKSAALPRVLLAQVDSGPVAMARRRLLIPNQKSPRGGVASFSARVMAATDNGPRKFFSNSDHAPCRG